MFVADVSQMCPPMWYLISNTSFLEPWWDMEHPNREDFYNNNSRVFSLQQEFSLTMKELIEVHIILCYGSTFDNELAILP